MDAKEKLHRLVDQITTEEAEDVLDYVRWLTRGERDAVRGRDGAGKVPAAC